MKRDVARGDRLDVDLDLIEPSSFDSFRFDSFAFPSAEHHQLSSASATCLDELDAALTDYDDVCECELVVSKH